MMMRGEKSAWSPLLDAIDQEMKALTRASDSLSWLHPHTCKALVLLFQTAFHKLQSLLHYASKLLPPAHLHSCASRALLQLLAVMKGTHSFIDTAALYEREASAQLETLPHDAQSWPLLRAVMFGVGTHAVNLHLHDFLLAYASATEAIMFAVEKKKAELAAISRHESQLVLRQPAMSWSMDRGKPHILTLNDDGVLGLHRERDLESLLSRIRGKFSLIKTPSFVTGRWGKSHPILDLGHRRRLERFVERVLEMERGRKDVSYRDDDLFLNLSFNGVVTLESLHKVERSVHVKKVKWEGEEFALKQFESEMFVHLTQETHISGNLISHPNIVQVFCLMEDMKKRERAMLMELMEGTLEKLVFEQELSLLEKVNIMLQISKAMEYIHSKGIIHRDLKPLNVLYKLRTPSSQGAGYQRTFQIKVADFNISKLNLGTNLTERQGTDIFRAPEVLNQEEDRPRYTYPADVYSFAMVSYQILSGKPPFEGIQPTRSLYDDIMHRNRRPDLSSVQCPPYLQHCLREWWHAEPEKRPCFLEICRTLRHLTGALLRCQDPMEELPFLKWSQQQWNIAHDRIRAGMCHWVESQACWKEELEYPSAYTTVIDIPYELQTMKMLVESYDGGFLQVTEGPNQLPLTADLGEMRNWGKPDVLYSTIGQHDVLHDGAMFYLKSVTLGTYVSVVSGNGTRVGVSGQAPFGGCETFKMWRHRDTIHSFRDTTQQWHYCRDKIFSIQGSCNRYLSIHMTKNATIVSATATFPGEKEKFAFTRAGNRVHIRSIFTGMYLQAKDESVLTSDYSSKGEPSWDDNDATFEMTILPAG